MEALKREAGVAASFGMEPYLRDFSTVVSFTLNCICTPDIDLARRLISGKDGLFSGVAPQKPVRRFCDKDIWLRGKSEEIKFVTDFICKLIGLHRRTFLRMMRAIRRYVNGMYRIADDLEWAYILLVVSVESLAQELDEYRLVGNQFMNVNEKPLIKHL